MTEMDDEQLDDLLHAWRTEPASMQLRDAVLATAPRPGTGGFRLPAGLQGGLRLWFAGAGLAAALAGVSCGAVVSSVAVREAQDEALVTAAVSESSNAVASFADPTQS